MNWQWVAWIHQHYTLCVKIRSSCPAPERRSSLAVSVPVSHTYAYNHPRSWFVRLNHLRIGHTKLTHEYLLTGDPQPYLWWVPLHPIPITKVGLVPRSPNANNIISFSCPIWRSSISVTYQHWYSNLKHSQLPWYFRSHHFSTISLMDVYK